MTTKQVVYDTLRLHLDSIDLHKKSRGEVFTAMSIVNEQLSHLPTHVWKDPEFKWLDVASGMGNYAIHCYYKLMDTLSSHSRFEDPRKRSKHIIENMIYMIEIDEVNLRSCKKMFNIIDPKANPNLINADFLEYTFAPAKYKSGFDVIVGNPPYAKPNKKNITKLSTRSIYPDIIAKSIDLLKVGGHLSFIHPVSWRRYSRESRFSFDDHDLLFMYTNNNFTGFGISAPYINYYVLRKTHTPKLKTDCVTIFNDRIYRSSVNLKNRPFLPMLLNNMTMRILRKLVSHDEKDASIPVDIKIISSNSTTKKSISSTKSSEFRFKNVHNYSVHKGQYLYRYSRKAHKSHNLKKIVMIYRGGYKYFKPFYDEGRIGITDNAMFMPVEEQHKETVLEFFKSDIVDFVLRTCNYNYGRNMKNEYKILNMMRIPTGNGNTSNRDILHQYYGLTKPETRFVRQIALHR